MRMFSMLRYVTVAMGIALILLSTHGMAQNQPADSKPAAQATPPADARPEAQKVSIFAIVRENNDFVFWLILICSVFGLTFIIQGFLRARESVIMPVETTDRIREMINHRQFQELLEFTEAEPSFISRALNPALKRAPSFSAMKEAMETSIGEQTADQFRRIEYLNIIGNLGPLLGLLGTVLGMIESFQAMQQAQGNANPALLAGGISKALTHTMLGLLLALPCLAAFGVLRTMIDRLTVRAAIQAEELLLMIKPAEARPAAMAGRPGAPTAAPVPAMPAPMPS
jgi:biopolymer transport protein ExbB